MQAFFFFFVIIICMQKILSKQKDFTLIELLVVVSIIAVLATIILGALGDARSKARDTKRISELKQLQTSLELYYLDNGVYPSAISSGCATGVWETPLNSLLNGGYISKLPVDPIDDEPSFLCYNYYGGTSVSGWYCDGVLRSNYGYAILFSLENQNTSVKTTTSGGFSHCMVGPLK